MLDSQQCFFPASVRIEPVGRQILCLLLAVLHLSSQSPYGRRYALGLQALELSGYFGRCCFV